MLLVFNMLKHSIPVYFFATELSNTEPTTPETMTVPPGLSHGTSHPKRSLEAVATEKHADDHTDKLLINSNR